MNQTLPLMLGITTRSIDLNLCAFTLDRLERLERSVSDRDLATT